MSNAQELSCPNCGAPLDFTNDGDTVVQCLYCQTKVIVPESLRASVRPSTPTVPLDLQKVTELLRAGNKIAAIKLYKDSTGSSLKEAKLAVEGMQLNFTLDGGNLQ